MENKVCNILGNGATIKTFIPNGLISFGCNYILDYVQRCEYIMAIDVNIKDEYLQKLNDNPDNFIRFFSGRPEYKGKVNKFTQLIYSDLPRKYEDIQHEEIYPFSSVSMFTVPVLAYRMGFREMNFYGVDFNIDYAYCREDRYEKEFYIKSIHEDFARLYSEMKKLGCIWRVSSKESALSKFVPLMSNIF